MKNIKRLFATTLLALTVCVATYAGDIQTPTVNNPPPSGSQALGEIDSSGTSETGDIDTAEYISILLDVFTLV